MVSILILFVKRARVVAQRFNNGVIARPGRAVAIHAAVWIPADAGITKKNINCPGFPPVFLGFPAKGQNNY